MRKRILITLGVPIAVLFATISIGLAQLLRIDSKASRGRRNTP